MRKEEKGFTLIELVISMTLLSIILIAASGILFSGLKSWTSGEQQIDVVQNIRVGMDYMVREIRAADMVKTANADYIVITLPNADFTASYDVRYQYDAVDQELERKRGNDAPQPVASRISGLSFSYSGSPVKIVDITLTGKRKDGHEVTLKSEVSLRSVK